MGLDDYLQKLNDKMTMTTNDNVGWFKLIKRLENLLFEIYFVSLQCHLYTPFRPILPRFLA